MTTTTITTTNVQSNTKTLGREANGQQAGHFSCTWQHISLRAYAGLGAIVRHMMCSSSIAVQPPSMQQQQTLGTYTPQHLIHTTLSSCEG